MRRFEGGMNVDAIATHARIVVGRRARCNRPVASMCGRSRAPGALLDSNGIRMAAIDKLLAAPISRQLASICLEAGQLARAVAAGA